MNESSPHNSLSRDSRLDEMVARFLRAEEHGEPFDVEAEAQRHLDCADEFRAFVESHLRMRGTNSPTTTFETPPSTEPTVEPWTDATAPGNIVGDCRILRELGRGGMGIVFLGEHIRVKDLRAIKVLPRDRVTDHAIRRFWREAQSAARINHLNVVTIHDVGQLKELHYIVMQYVDGKTLVELVDRHLLRSPQAAFSWTHAFQLILPVLDALAAMHRQNLLHRDIKPSNIMATGVMSRRQHVLLMDFGLVQDQSDATITDSGAVVGTPAYMSCEQARGKELDGRADLYSVGATLYFLLTGRAPFQGNRTEVYLRVAAGDKPTSLEELRPDLPPEVRALVAKAMSPERGQRFRRAEEMLREMAVLLRKASGRSSKPKSASAAQDPSRQDAEAPKRPVPPEQPQLPAPPPVPTRQAPHDTVSSAGETNVEPLPNVAPLEAVLTPSSVTLGKGAGGSHASSGSGEYWRRDEQESEFSAMLANLLRTRWFAPVTATAIVAVLALTLLIVLVVSNLGDDSRPGESARVATPPDSSPPAEKPPEGMIEIPAGNVVLGADEGRLRLHARSVPTISESSDQDSLVEQFVELCNDSPYETVAVEAFWIDQYEVTNAEYAKFVADTGQPPPSDWPNRSPAPGKENYPVTHVSHEDATAYAKWAGKQLPTEAQWLRAYRADTEYMYPWGDLWEDRRIGAFPAVKDEQLRPVDAFPEDRTTFGVIGMVGNVCEYVRDRSRRNGVSMAIIKGSDCEANGDIYSAAPACRQAEVDNAQESSIGFRCVIEKAR